jgi:hypothetical protein
MRKWLIMLLAVLGFSSAASAQNFSLRLGPELTLAPGFSFGLGAQLNAKEVARFSSSVSLGLYGRFGLEFGGGAVGFQLGFGPTVNLEFDRAKGDAYFGLAFGVASNGGGSAAFIFGFVMGAEYQVTPTVNLFSSLLVVVVPGTLGALDLGADFTVSRGLDLYAKIAVGFNGTFGLGGGLKLSF